MTQIRTPEFGDPPLAVAEFFGYDLDRAAHDVAQAMATFDAHVANLQGACDTGSMKAMMAEARRRYEEATDY